MPETTTATELQRNYKKVVARAKKIKKPLTVLSNNRPELIVMDYKAFKNLQKASQKTERKSGRKTGVEAVFGSWTEEEAEEFDKIIEDAFEKVNPEDWK